MEFGSLGVAFVLIALGILLLLGELFIPAHGTLMLVALVCIVGGIVSAFHYDTTAGTITLLVVGVGLPSLGGLLLRLWPYTRVGRSLMLQVPDPEATAAAAPTLAGLDRLRGRVGRAVSDLRPSGTCEFDGERIDTMTEGLMVDSGHWVRCVEVRGGRVIVRPIPEPQARAFDDMELN